MEGFLFGNIVSKNSFSEIIIYLFISFYSHIIEKEVFVLKMNKTPLILTSALALMAVAPITASAQQTNIEPTTEQTTSNTQLTEINSPQDYIAWLKGQDRASQLDDWVFN
ncbi:hypothetical protein D3C74_340350 [compost metagenome]